MSLPVSVSVLKLDELVGGVLHGPRKTLLQLWADAFTFFNPAKVLTPCSKGHTWVKNGDKAGGNKEWGGSASEAIFDPSRHIIGSSTGGEEKKKRAVDGMQPFG